MRHFVNDRFGWECLRCRDAAGDSDGLTDDGRRAPLEAGRARFFHEGEAEEGGPRLSTRAQARRREQRGRSFLFCPACGAEEEVG